jgi:hypothetical protein
VLLDIEQSEVDIRQGLLFGHCLLIHVGGVKILGWVLCWRRPNMMCSRGASRR